ncbi:sialidase family protein [Lacticaseibacillus yichunensis]|uniref:exo-alpha-sialidase n=1 Tax=Lacticaseibacillus yichunensis TaxID=2486015 RepID=A0ABW4CSC8_9LACO|nr:sialidase family protein [Lacticaseibacillus yichunensis]
MALFEPETNGIATYRIPNLLTTAAGTVLAFADGRVASSNDSPNEIHCVLRRSTDGGATFGLMQTVVAYPGRGLNGASAIDSSSLQDPATGCIWVLFSHSPSGVGLFNSVVGTGFGPFGRRLSDEAGHLFSVDGAGIVRDAAGTPTGQQAAGTMIDGHHWYHARDKAQDLMEQPTVFLQTVFSDDDGVTWSAPIDLNPQVKQPWMSFLGAGPGIGTVIEAGAHQGRLLFPVYFANAAHFMSAALIYSDDHGATWQLGETPNAGRVVAGQVIDPATSDVGAANLTEAQAVVAQDGTVQLFMRNHLPAPHALVATSGDGGGHFDTLRPVTGFQTPINQASYLYDRGKTVLLASHAESATETRQNGQIHLSRDGGQTWSQVLQVEPPTMGFGYSCLTQLDDQRFAVLYERIADQSDWAHMRLCLKIFTLADFSQMEEPND